MKTREGLLREVKAEQISARITRILVCYYSLWHHSREQQLKLLHRAKTLTLGFLSERCKDCEMKLLMLAKQETKTSSKVSFPAQPSALSPRIAASTLCPIS